MVSRAPPTPPPTPPTTQHKIDNWMAEVQSFFFLKKETVWHFDLSYKYFEYIL